MVRVYISSTAKDLAEYRRTAADAVAKLDLRGVAMESYVASSRQPLAKCLEDVRSCQIYIGIIAWRYGYVPGPEQGGDGRTSITEHEYRAADEADIPRLMFLSREGLDWPKSDRDPSAVRRFRDRVRKELIVDWFHSPQTLAYAVAVALGNHLQKSAPQATEVEIDPLLPYLSDRSEQSYQLKAAFDRNEESARRPIVAVIHGDEDEAHGEFVKRLRRVTLPRLLELDGEAKPVHHCRFEWSEPRPSLDERLERLRGRLAEALTGSRGATPADLVSEISRRRSPVILSTQITSDDWQPKEPELIRCWLATWGADAWPDLPPGQLLLVVLSVVYQLPSRRKGESWLAYKLRERGAEKRREEAAECVARLAGTTLEGARIEVLDRLTGLKEKHVLDWIENQAGRLCREARGAIRDPILLKERLAPWVESFFREFEHPGEDDGIPMAVLAPELRRQLQRCLEGG